MTSVGRTKLRLGPMDGKGLPRGNPSDRSRGDGSTERGRYPAEHVTLEVGEGIDRMYLNVYVPGLQSSRGWPVLPQPSGAPVRLLRR